MNKKRREFLDHLKEAHLRVLTDIKDLRIHLGWVGNYIEVLEDLDKKDESKHTEEPHKISQGE